MCGLRLFLTLVLLSDKKLSNLCCEVTQLFSSLQPNNADKISFGCFLIFYLILYCHRNPFYKSLHECFFEAVLRQTTGYVTTHWIADFTIRELKSLLCSTSLTVVQLADQLNFPDSSFLARYFRRHTGMSPQEYRLQQGK